MAVQPERRRFTVDEYHWMGRVGILGPDDRVELLDGEIICMVPIDEPHASTVDRINQVLVLGLQGAAIVRVQSSIRLDMGGEPEPDFALLRPRRDFYRASHPTPEDVLLVIEVADTSLDYDTRTKAPLYARAGIPELWVVDLPHARVIAYRASSADGYATTRAYRRGESLSPLAFPSLTIAIDDILG